MLVEYTTQEKSLDHIVACRQYWSAQLEIVGRVKDGEERRGEMGDVDGSENETSRTNRRDDCCWLEARNCHLNIEQDMAILFWCTFRSREARKR